IAQLTLGPEQSRVRAKLFDWHAVRSETVDAHGVSTLEVELTARRWQELRSTLGLAADSIRETSAVSDGLGRRRQGESVAIRQGQGSGGSRRHRPRPPA